MPINKTVKNIIMGFTLLCAIMLIIFAVELIRQNRDSEAAGGGESSVSGDRQPGGGGGQDAGDGGQGEDAPDGGEGNAGGNAGGDGGDGGDRGQAGNQRPTPTGTRHEVLLPGNMKLVLYLDKELFELSESELGNTVAVIAIKGSGTAEIEINYIELDREIGAYAARYLQTDYGVDNPVAGEEDNIGLSALRGIKSEGIGGGKHYEAWIYKFPNPIEYNPGLAFVLVYENTALKDALYEIINSLEIAYQA